MKNKLEVMRNFTAVLPVTCNASCSFCPEKEMEEKAGQNEWLENLIRVLNEHEGEFDHVSLSGGEATLRTKYLFRVVDAIQERTSIQKIGLTSNGQFLEKQASTLTFLDLNTNDQLESKLSHLNISMHSFDRERANEIMGVTYKHDLNDLVRFRRQLGRKISFHINFVITENTDYVVEFLAALDFMEANPYIDVVFRVDYNNKELSRELRDYAMSVEEYHAQSAYAVRSRTKFKAPKVLRPKIVQKFDGVFGHNEDHKEGGWTTGCPSCFTHCSDLINKSHAYLKASSYEPNEDEEEYTEYVFHMDGKLYYDWSRNEPVLPALKIRGKKLNKPKPENFVEQRDAAYQYGSVAEAINSQRCTFGDAAPQRCNYDATVVVPAPAKSKVKKIKKSKKKTEKSSGYEPRSGTGSIHDGCRYTPRGCAY